MSTREATCNCGQLRAKVVGEPVRVSICHCLACKRRTGSAFGHNAGFNAEQVKVEGLWKSYSRTGASEKELRFNFCPECGATVFYEADIRPGLVNIPVGAFAETDFPAPTIEVYPERKVTWCEAVIKA